MLEKSFPQVEELPAEDSATRGTGFTCSFCHRVSLFMEEMEDGRYICHDCKDHQLSQKDEIRQLYADTVRLLETGYGISVRKNLHVYFKSAEDIRKALGDDGSGGRCLGFYYDRKKQLWLESQGPRIAMQATLFHELTHSWQHDVLPLKKLRRALPKAERNRLMLLLMEGHAMYVEIDAMRRLKEFEYADRLHEETWNRKDEYGVGYHLLYDRIRSKGEEGSHMNAFAAMRELVDDIIEGRLKFVDGEFKECEAE